jgi:hypothetical protein
MKRVLFLVLAAAAVFTACEKKAAQPVGGDAVLEEDSVVSQEMIHAYTLRVDTSLMTADPKNFGTGTEADIVKWAKGLPLGEEVYLYGDKPVDLTYNKKVYPFYKITAGDTEGYLFDNQFAAGDMTAVVVSDKASIYNSAKNVDVTGSYLPIKTFMVISGMEGDFVKFKAFDTVIKTTRSAYLKTSAISTSASDVEAAKLLLTAETVDASKEVGKNRREALLNTALEYNSVFNNEILLLLNPNEYGAAEEEIGGDFE